VLSEVIGASGASRDLSGLRVDAVQGARLWVLLSGVIGALLWRWLG
jgi:type II secretory pathway component PulM